MIKRTRARRVPKEFSRSSNSEKDVIKNLINGFEPRNSRGAEYLKYLTDKEIEDLSKYNIVCLGKIIASYYDIKFSRNHQRSKILAIKWFDEHFEMFGDDFGPISYI